jgi:hypothetical protein
MQRKSVDLASHLNHTVERGHPADFPVSLVPVECGTNGMQRTIPHRLAVVREDTGDALAVVSDRYTLVRHQTILDAVDAALTPLDVGPVPRGRYVDRGGARMRAIYKFPALAQVVARGDEICPCLQVRNTYDGTSRIGLHIGAFRFVCTNLAVGGGGVFAGGFMAVHAGEIPIEAVTEELASYLNGFDAIATLYQRWQAQRLVSDALWALFNTDLGGRPDGLREIWVDARPETVYAAYNLATNFASHRLRSATAAFHLLGRINRAFQERFVEC